MKADRDESSPYAAMLAAQVKLQAIFRYQERLEFDSPEFCQMFGSFAKVPKSFLEVLV